MEIILMILGTFFIVLGSQVYYRPSRIKSFHNHLMHAAGYNINVIIMLIVGVLLLIAAPASKLDWFTFLIGMSIITLGILFLIVHTLHRETLIEKWMRSSKKVCKCSGILLMLFGLALIFFTR